MEKKKYSITSLLTTIIFLVFIFSFFLINIFTKKIDFSENENRYLAKAPATTMKNIFFGEFDTEFETYFSDHFCFRDKWIEIKSNVLKWSGAIENNGVYFAKDNHLINQFINYDENIALNNIQYINEFAKDNNIEIHLLLVPGAAYGNKDYLPFGATNIDEKVLIQKIYSLSENINCIDISDSLCDGDNYYMTDHHWNHLGAYKGYEALVNNVLNKEANIFDYEKVSSSFYGTMYSRSGSFNNMPDSIYKMISDKDISYEINVDGEIYNSLFFENRLKEKDKYTYYLDGNHTEVNIKSNIDNGKKAIIIKDSYAHILLPYLASEYSEMDIFDLRYFHNAISPYIQDNTDIYIIYGIETFVSDSSLVGLW